MVPFWGRCTTPFRTYFSCSLGGAIWILTHGQMEPNRSTAEVAELLVALGCDATLQADQGETALHLAARFGHGDVVRFLVERSPELCEARRGGGGGFLDCFCGGQSFYQ